MSLWREDTKTEMERKMKGSPVKHLYYDTRPVEWSHFVSPHPHSAKVVGPPGR